RTFDGLGNRVYLYQDYVDVPFSVWDVDHNTQLNAAFLEDAGAPTQDGKWGPDASTFGGREILWVLASAYSGPTPDPFYTDPANPDLLQGTLDLRYAFWSRKVSVVSFIDNGDLVRFSVGLKPTPSAETMLLRLAGLPPGPDVTVQYSQLAECLGAINRGEIF